ncbi:MAG: MarR family transcriptional regulator [Carnobacterium sp.]|uniref:MarR family winged helix-turn-helix transcriptional regulator n=1 Tax=Carnobacterium TaxID=2747 RepID=UPI00295E4F24|nr:MarR family transcriptional regulator [Carnobacterium maltaromaticum]
MTLLTNTLIDLQCELVAERNMKNPQNISWLQYDILHHLSLKEEQLPSEISIALGISRTKLSKALKELKLTGYIIQKPSEKDGRELITSLSDSGKQFLQTINLGHQQLSQVADNIFTEEEKIQFALLSSKFSSALKEERTGFHE